MENYIYVRINGSSYRLNYLGGGRWRLFYLTARRKLNINLAHGLDYWRKRGVIQGEKEKKR